MSKETLIVFVYDTEYCKNESNDPINAVLYFHPSWVSDVQKVALCGQLMGTSQFLKNCFFRPKTIALQNGKFVFKDFGRFIMASGTDRNISDFLLQQRANLLASLIEFFHRDLQTVYDQFTSQNHQRNVSEKLYHIFGTFLPILQYNGNILQNITKLRIPKIGSNIFLQAMHTLQNLQQTKGVLGGAILYHNKIVASQLSDNITKNIVFTDPHRIKTTAELISVNFHIPVGVQIISVYIPIQHFKMLLADAYRSQTLQTQHLSHNTPYSHFQKRKIKRDRSLIFTNIPEEQSCDQIEHFPLLTKKNSSRPTHLPLKEIPVKDLLDREAHEEKSYYPGYLGRTSVSSTPMTENKVLNSNGFMSICVNPLENDASKVAGNSFNISFDKLLSRFITNSENVERRNSYTDLQHTKEDIASPRLEKILRARSDPNSWSLNDNEQPCSIFKQGLNDFTNDLNTISKTNKVDETIESCKNSVEIANKIENNASDDQLGKKQVNIRIDKKSLSLPLKKYNEFQSENIPNMPLERRRNSGIQLTPLMAKLSVLAIYEDKYSSCINSADKLQGVDSTTTEKKCRSDKGLLVHQSSNERLQSANGFQKIELYLCVQQNMTMVLLLEHGSALKQDLVQTMFEKCVAKLSKMESLLCQTLNVNMKEGLTGGVYSLICLDFKWDTLLNHGPWTPLDQSCLEHLRSDLSKEKCITDIFLRVGEGILYGFKSGRTEFFFKESSHFYSGIPPPSDPIGTVAKRAKTRLEEDFSILLI